MCLLIEDSCESRLGKVKVKIINESESENDWGVSTFMIIEVTHNESGPVFTELL